MIKDEGTGNRDLLTVELAADLVVVGGGLAGTCGAIAAAREGLKVILVQDRPVLGGNCSSEVRLWILGATAHMGNNNRWAREGGIINEILEENLYRNRHGNPHIVDTILLEKVVEEPNITLLLNSAVYDLETDSDRISLVRAFCSQNSTRYEVAAPLFCDASGDGIVGFMAGAAFRMGAEGRDEFGEKFAPDAAYGELLGHSLYFYTKDTGTPVKYVPPSYALQDVRKIPRYRQFASNMHGCQLWWIEYGGRLDTVHETETIKWELWKIVYGVWNHIKNSGDFPEAANLTLEWVGHIPGKRESRRFEGDHIISQNDLVQQRVFEDTVAHGGWAIDLHPADGVYSELPACSQWHTKGVYGIPYRCYYSRNIANLFLAGRITSASHVAFASTRVMATCAAGGEAVGTAAAICREQHLSPRELRKGEPLAELQRRLSRRGQFLPDVTATDPEDLAADAVVSASSELALDELPTDNGVLELHHDWAMLLPATKGPFPRLSLQFHAPRDTEVVCELWRALRPGNFTPDELLGSAAVPVKGGVFGPAALEFGVDLDREGYVFVVVKANSEVTVHLSNHRVTGVLAVSNDFNRSVATANRQDPPGNIGIDSFEFWLPKRRPDGRNMAFQSSEPLHVFAATNVIQSESRPTEMPNAWVAGLFDENPELTLTWAEVQSVRRIVLFLDPDWDHPMESVLMTHPEDVGPFMVKDFDLLDDSGNTLAIRRDNHRSRVEIELDAPARTSALKLKILASYGSPAAVFRIQCFER